MMRAIAESSMKLRFVVVVIAVTLTSFSIVEIRDAPAMAQGSTTAQKEFEDFNPSNFSRSTIIDNEWFPLKPGRRVVYEGFTNEEGRPVPHRLISTVTDLTKVIDGVRTVVIWETDYAVGKLVETEIAFLAQDNDGNVWRLGEYPEEWENGKFVKAPAWIHGRDGARAGISMQAKPRKGTPSYSQGWAPAVSWTDRGVVDQVGQKVCVRLGCYEDVLVIAEFNKEEPDAYQLKYYARGVGNIRTGWRGKGEKVQETLDLVELTQLDAAALAQARAAALKLDQRAYSLSRKAYSGTPPAELMTGAK